MHIYPQKNTRNKYHNGLKITFFLEGFLAYGDISSNKAELVKEVLAKYPDLEIRDQNGGKFKFDKSQS